MSEAGEREQRGEGREREFNDWLIDYSEREGGLELITITHTPHGRVSE
jgi:hypothetical protein